MQRWNMEGSGELAFDLRVYYAKIVGEHLIDISIARKNKAFPAYFEALGDLHVIVAHKIRKKELKKLKGKKVRITYGSLRKKAVEIINKNKDAYHGKSSDPKEVGEIFDILRTIEKHLYKRMDEANMFGAKSSQEGLV